MTTKPKLSYSRSSSLGNMFKKRQPLGYQPWDENSSADILLADENPAEDVDAADSNIMYPSRSVDLQQGVSLVECFYLGSHDMEGREVRGRGCIDTVAGELWQQTQEDPSRKRRRSLHGRREAFTPRYVKLVAGKDHLQMRDEYSSQVIAAFPYCLISFVGTHPKYERLFAFIAHEKGKSTPFCYAFKCEDRQSACTTAQQLDGVFHQRCRELQILARPSESVVTCQQLDYYNSVVNGSTS